MLSLRKLYIFCAVLGVFAVAGCGDSSTNAVAQKSSKPATELKLGNWGPQETIVGIPVNPQPNGKSALWFQVTGINTEAGVQVFFGEQPMEDVTANDTLVTAAIPMALLQKPGDQTIVIAENGSKRRLTVGTFRIVNKAAK